MGKEQLDLEEKENPEIDEPADSGDISDSLLDGDDNFDDDSDDDDDDDDDDWDLTDSFHEQERGAELSQIEAFLNQTLMVRCERYNANMTSISCRRKKESPPPRLKNATLSEEENMQNHPCFACVGPIIVNWNIDESPIALHEVEKQRVIVHPNLEDDFTAARAKQIELYKEQSKSQTKYPGLELVEAGEAGSPPPIVIETNDEERPRRGRKNMRIAVKTAARDSRLKDDDDDDDDDDDLEFDPAKDAKIKLSKSLEIDDDDDLDDDLDLDLDDDDDDSSTSFAHSDDDDNDDNADNDDDDDEPILASAQAASKNTKASRSKKTSARQAADDDDDDDDADADDDDDDEIEPPKAKKAAKAKKQVAEPKTSKATSKKTNKASAEKSPKTESKSAKAPEKKVKSPKTESVKAKPSKEEEQASENTEDQPPCASCGRDYSPKHWRGDLCNPCYAKKLRERKKKEQSKGEVIAPPKTTEDQPPCASCGRDYSPKHWRGDTCNPCYAKKLRERKKKQKPKK